MRHYWVTCARLKNMIGDGSVTDDASVAAHTLLVLHEEGLPSPRPTLEPDLSYTEDTMGLMDRVREQAAQIAQRTQEAAQEGRVKLDEAQARRRADAMFRDLGAAVYAERTGRGGPDGADKIDRLVKALSRQEAEQGLGDGKGPSAPPGA